MWTRFSDSHSGGGIKEKPYEKIYIEADIEMAKVIFYNKFGHNPERVSCTCCGDDYSIDSSHTISQATGFDRGCRNLITPRDPETGLYKNELHDTDLYFRDHFYLEEGEEPEPPYKVDKDFPRFRKKYLTLEEYEALENVLIIREHEISSEEKSGEVPDQGYYWKD